MANLPSHHTVSIRHRMDDGLVPERISHRSDCSAKTVGLMTSGVGTLLQRTTSMVRRESRSTHPRVMRRKRISARSMNAPVMTIAEAAE